MAKRYGAVIHAKFVGPTLVVVYPSCFSCLTGIGVRPAEPCSVSVVATHQLLTQIFEHHSGLQSIRSIALEDRKYGYFWIFPHHSCENIQKYFEFLDTFGYSPIISEPVSKISGGLRPPKTSDSCSEIIGEYPKVFKNSKCFWIFSQL